MGWRLLGAFAIALELYAGYLFHTALSRPIAHAIVTLLLR